MRNIGKPRRATAAAMDNPYRQGFDAGRDNRLGLGNPYPEGSSSWIDWRDGFEKGYELWLQCEQAAGRIHELAERAGLTPSDLAGRMNDFDPKEEPQQ